MANHRLIEHNLTGTSGVSPTVHHHAGPVSLMAQYVSGSGTTSLEFSLDGGTTWDAVGDNTTVTATGGGNAPWLPACILRAALSDGSSANIFVSIG